jgi:hypothetical protein
MIEAPCQDRCSLHEFIENALKDVKESHGLKDGSLTDGLLFPRYLQNASAMRRTLHRVPL